MVESLRRALLNEKQLDINDVGIGAIAMQKRTTFSNPFQNNKFSSYVMLGEAQRTLENKKMGSYYDQT